MSDSKITQKKISSASPFYDDDDITSIQKDVGQILKSKRLVLGPYTRKLEEKFSEYIGTKYGIAVNSATAALDISLRYCDVKDYEVIVPTNTFIACANTVLYAGGKPVFADMDPKSFCIDLDDVKKKISSKTKVIMVVHLSGLPEPHLHDLLNLCAENNIKLIEDCSHAHGSSKNGKKVGSFGVAGCFSFFATKIIPTGTGGIITTDDPKLYSFAEALRHQGGLGGEGQIEVFDKLGYDWMMSEITAALGINQLEKLEKQIKKRIELANFYTDELKNIEGIKIVPDYPNTRNVYWKYIITLDKNSDRNKIREVMRNKFFIDAGILYPTLCHLQPIYRNMGHHEGECPKAEQTMKHQLTLPINPYMTKEDVKFVVESLKHSINNA